MWQTRRELRVALRAHSELTHDQLEAFVAALWVRPVFELRLAAALALEARADLLGPPDLALLVDLIRQSGTWALVDVLAGDVAAVLAADDPCAATTIDAWARDPDFWVRRAALLSCLAEANRGAPLERFFRYADDMLEEREFFIRKAIGWVLREAAKKQPDLVYDWLRPRAARASGVTMREAVKYLRPDQREALLLSRAKPPPLA